MKAWWWLGAGLFALIVHLPAKDGEFLFYDDQRFVVRNPHIEEVGNPGRFFTDLSTATDPDAPTQDIYRPLRTLAYAVIGKDAVRIHWTAIVLHALTTALLVLLLHQAGLAPWSAAAGALVFGLHPVTVETTAWICSLGDAMCGLFVVLALLAHARDRSVLALLALAVALFCKEHAVVVPGLWLAWNFFVRPERGYGRTWAVGLAVVIGFLVFRSTVVGAKMSQVDEGYSLATILAGLGWYAGTLLFPFGPTFDARVQEPALFSLPVLAGVATLAGLVAMALRGPKQTRLASVWFLMALVPVANLFVTLKIPTADRFLYLPLMGLAFAGAWLAERSRPYAAPAVLLGLALLTVARIGDWRDDKSLIEAGMRVDPRNKMLIWADASMLAKQAIEMFEARDPKGMIPAEAAMERYDTYLRNARPGEQVQVRIEVGDLMYATGRFLQRHAPDQDWRSAYTDALTNYHLAFQLQLRDVGRIIEDEVLKTALRVLELSKMLAVPGDKKIGQKIASGLEAAGYLDRAGVDVRFQVAQLRFADSAAVRVKEPKRARTGFDVVLGILDQLESEGTKGTTYLRAQAVFYRAITKSDFGSMSRSGLEESFGLYVRAARENRGLDRVQCLLYAARSGKTLAQHFKDREWGKRGLSALKSAYDEVKQRKIPLPQSVQREADSLFQDLKKYRQ